MSAGALGDIVNVEGEATLLLENLGKQLLFLTWYSLWCVSHMRVAAEWQTSQRSGKSNGLKCAGLDFCPSNKPSKEPARLTWIASCYIVLQDCLKITQVAPNAINNIG